MSVMQPPIVGTWYINAIGKAFKVRLLSYSGNSPSGVVVEYIEGSTQLVSLYDWLLLDLRVYDWPYTHQSASTIDRPTH